MKRKIIFDCDNTMGIPACDIDDGLALFCLLASKDIEILGISTTFGNNKTQLVYENTKNMLQELGLSIPVYLGGQGPLDYDSEAARFIAKMSREYKNELEILATGSLTNIAGASLYHKDFYNDIKSLTLMGGIVEDLIFEKKKMDELNFSIDYKSTYQILTKAHNISIMTGNACLDLIFELGEYRENLLKSKKGLYNIGMKSIYATLGEYILDKTKYWFSYNEEIYGIKGFYNWDALAALYLLYPNLFSSHKAKYLLSESDLQRGYLREAICKEGILLNLPRVRDKDGIKEKFYKSFV